MRKMINCQRVHLMVTCVLPTYLSLLGFKEYNFINIESGRKTKNRMTIRGFIVLGLGQSFFVFWATTVDSYTFDAPRLTNSILLNIIITI